MQRHFAAGRVIHVADHVDLVEVAFVIARDDARALEGMMLGGSVGPVKDDTARTWYEDDAVVWAVVARPWVLVQHDPDAPPMVPGVAPAAPEPSND